MSDDRYNLFGLGQSIAQGHIFQGTALMRQEQEDQMRRLIESRIYHHEQQLRDMHLAAQNALTSPALQEKLRQNVMQNNALFDRLVNAYGGGEDRRRRLLLLLP